MLDSKSLSPSTKRQNKNPWAKWLKVLTTSIVATTSFILTKHIYKLIAPLLNTLRENYNEGSETENYTPMVISQDFVPMHNQPVIFFRSSVPIIDANQFSIAIGEQIILKDSNIHSTNSDNTTKIIDFYINNTQHGWFALYSSPEAPITQFSQYDIGHGSVIFRHEKKSFSAPYYELRASTDGLIFSNISYPTIAFTGYYAPLQPESLIDSTIIDYKNPLQLATLADGNSITIYKTNSFSCHVYGLIMAANGMIGGPFSINITAGSRCEMRHIFIGALDTGFIITWNEYRLNSRVNLDTYARIFHTNGTAKSARFKVNDNMDGSHKRPKVAKLSNGNIVITWCRQEKILNKSSIFFKIYSPNATALVTEKLVTIPGNNLTYPSIGAYANDGFVIVWQSRESIYAQNYYTNGMAGIKLHVNKHFTCNFPNPPLLAILANNRIIIGWRANINENNIYLAIFNQDGTVYKPEFKFTITTNYDHLSYITALANNKFICVYDVPGQGIFVKVFNENAVPYGEKFRINTYIGRFKQHLVAASLADGNFVVAWQLPNGSYYHAYQRICGSKNFSPHMTNNMLDIAEGETKIITPTEIAISDDNPNSNLTLIPVVTHGKFTRAGNSTPLNYFTQSQINTWQIHFVHAGGTTAPTIFIKISDGNLNSTLLPTKIIFHRVNHPPKIINNMISLAQGNTVQLSATNIAAIDADSPIANLQILVHEVNYGHFAYKDSPELQIFSFPQFNISSIVFIHDGSIYKPSACIAATDGIAYPPCFPTDFRFSTTPSIINIQASILTIALGSAIAVPLLAGIGFFTSQRSRHKNNIVENSKQKRQKSELAIKRNYKTGI